MSRRHKHRKERRSRNRPRIFPGRADSGFRNGPGDNDSAVLELFTYELTEDPLPDPYLDSLSPADRDRIDRIAHDFRHCPRDYVARLESCVRDFPDYPKVYNYLTVAYQDAGRYEDAKRLIRETCRRFPDYLFGVANYAFLCIQEGHPEKVPVVLGNRLALHHFCGGRRCFHVSEFVTLNALLAFYFWAIGKPDVAMTYRDALRKVAPDHSLTRRVDSLFRPASPLRRALAGWFERHDTHDR